MTPEQKAALEAARQRLSGGNTGMTPAQTAALEAARRRVSLVQTALSSHAAPLQPQGMAERFGGATPQPSVATGSGLAAAMPDNAALAAEIGQRAREGRVTGGGAFVRGVADGATFGFADEIGGAMVAPFVDGTYADVRDAARQSSADSMSARPASYVGGLVTGSVAVPGVGTARAATSAPTVGRAFIQGTGAGAVAGGLTGAGNAEGELDNRLSGAAGGAAIGSVLGGGLSAGANRLSEALQSFAQRRAMMAAAPSADELASNASAIFNRADGVTTLPRASLTGAFTGMQDDAVRAGMDDVLTPAAARAVSRVEDAATSPSPNLSFRELDILRRQSGVAAGKMDNRTEAAIGARLQEGIDEVLDMANAGLSAEVAAARNMWGRLRRSELITDAIARAENQASGFENGIRIQLRSILNDPKKLRGFSAAERQAMRDIVQGTTFGNIMRKVGKLGPGIGQQTNILGMGLGSGAGAAALGPVGAFMAPAVGLAAQKLAERSTTSGTAALEALVRSGGRMPAAQAGTASQAVPAAIMGQTGIMADELNRRLLQPTRTAP